VAWAEAFLAKFGTYSYVHTGVHCRLWRTCSDWQWGLPCPQWLTCPQWLMCPHIALRGKSMALQVNQLVEQLLQQVDELSLQVADVRAQAIQIQMALAPAPTPPIPPVPVAAAGPMAQPGGQLGAWGAVTGAKVFPVPPAAPPFKAAPPNLAAVVPWTATTSPTSSTSTSLMLPSPVATRPADEDDPHWMEAEKLLASIHEPRSLCGWRRKMWAMGEMRPVIESWGGPPVLDAQPYCCICDVAIESYTDAHWMSKKHQCQVYACFEEPSWYATAVLPRFITDTPILNFPTQKPPWCAHVPCVLHEVRSQLGVCTGA
jgi:hypothetical protein